MGTTARITEAGGVLWTTNDATREEVGHESTVPDNVRER
jgi:hypothetical protein